MSRATCKSADKEEDNAEAEDEEKKKVMNRRPRALTMMVGGEGRRSLAA